MLTNSGVANIIAKSHSTGVDALDKQMVRHLEGALNYADADRSDPFARNRAISHVLNGVTAPIVNGKEVKDCMYAAQREAESRTLNAGAQFSDGMNEYMVDVFRNVRRP